MSSPTSRALLVLPYLRIQNANAISSPLTHGFSSITAFIGLMWALQRKLATQGIPLQLLQVGVICHDYEEQVVDGHVKTFRLTRNPVDKDGSTAAIVEEGRIHLEITLVFLLKQASLPDDSTALLIQDNQSALDEWARKLGDTVATMRVAGGTVLPSQPRPGQRTRPWMAVLPEDAEAQAQCFARWRRQWLPGYALVGRDDLLASRLTHLRERQPQATVLDAWLHAARFNHEAGAVEAASEEFGPSRPGVRWADPLRGKGSGWTVPIPVGYARLTAEPVQAGLVANARDARTPVSFVESVYSLAEWISPHRLDRVQDLLWRAETDAQKGLYRCHSGYAHSDAQRLDEVMPDFD